MFWNVVVSASSKYVLAKEDIIVSLGTVSDFIPSKTVTSLSIKAPAVVTLAVSVLSANASMPSNFEPSVAKSLPSTVPDTDILPVTFIACEKSNSPGFWSHKIVASVEASTASCIVIPAPSAELEVSLVAW